MPYGKYFTDHMLTIDWSASNGWDKPKIVPYGPMKIAATATSLHYGISCYEGANILKNRETGNCQIFRPQMHIDQFLHSTNHIDLPLFDGNEFLDCLR